jgi:quercetin dioxygenase-like cupin family protein
MSAMPFQRRHVGVGLVVLYLALTGWAFSPYDFKKSTMNRIEGLSSSVFRPMFASAPSREVANARPATVVKPVSCEALPNVPGKTITTALVEFLPLAYSPAHRHPGSVTAFVIEGTIRSQLGGGPVADYKAGQTWFEPPGALHVFAENPDPVHAARLLATFITDENCGPLVLPADAK